MRDLILEQEIVNGEVITLLVPGEYAEQLDDRVDVATRFQVTISNSDERTFSNYGFATMGTAMDYFDSTVKARRAQW